MTSHHVLPRSTVPSYIGLAGLAGMALGVLLLWFLPAVSVAWVQIILVTMTGLPMWFLEWKRAPEAAKIRLKISLSERVLWRLYGALLYFVLFIGVLYFLMEFAPGIVAGFLRFLSNTWVALLFISLWFFIRPVYAAVDGLDALGRSLALRQGFDGFWDKIRGQLLKIFFLLLMFSFSASWLFNSSEYTANSVVGIVTLCVAILYMIDTVFALIGYLSTSRRLNSHIIESNPLWWSWVVTLICYPPFFGWLMDTGIGRYRDGLMWHDWLSHDSAMAWIWGGAIIALTTIYAWATVAFGVRFSNLTYRGVITNGPYRYTKHPAYLAKNLSWWLISIPFISDFSGSAALFSCSALVLINIIYFLRAKAEEKHLMRYTTYREYVAWISENGLVPRLKRKLSVVILPARMVVVSVLLFVSSGVLWLTTEQGSLYRFMLVNELNGAILIEQDSVEAYGSLKGQENELHSIASLSKLVTAAAIGRLLLSNDLELDMRVVDVLPTLNPFDLRFSDITIQHLLQHRAGFKRDVSSDPLFGDDGAVGCEKAIAVVEQRKLDVVPGVEMAYSNVGYCLLGAVLAERLNTSYEMSVYKLLFDGEEPDWLRMGEPALGAAGGWFARASDLARFLSNEFNEAVVLPDEGKLARGFYYGLGWRMWGSGCWTFVGDLQNVFAFVVRNADGSNKLGIFDGRIHPVVDVGDVEYLCR